MAFTSITVTGTYLKNDGTAASGTVSFVLSAVIQNSTTGQLHSPVLTTATLDATGAFSVSLVANDDTTTTPTGSSYKVTEQITGAKPNTYNVIIPHTAAGGTVALASLSPTTTTANYSYALVSNNLADLTDPATARSNLGLGSAATQGTSAFLQPSNNLSDVGTAATARTNLGLGSGSSVTFTNLYSAVYDNGGAVINALHPTYAVKGNGIALADGAMTASSKTLTSASASFTSADVGKAITVFGAGTAGAVLSTTIAAFVSATQVTLTAAAVGTVSSARVCYGTDDTAALQAVLNAGRGKRVAIPPAPSGFYYVNGRLNVDTAGTHIILDPAAKIIQNAWQTRLFYFTGDHCTLEGGWLYGVGKDWDNTQHTDAIGVYLHAASCTVRGCRIENFGCAGVQVHQAANSNIEGNNIVGIGSAGGLVVLSNFNVGVYCYVSAVGYPGLRIVGNSITNCAQGILTGNDWSELVIADNIIDHGNVGQHGMYLGSVIGGSVTGNQISNVPDTGIKCQQNNLDTSNTEGVSVTGNTIVNPGVSGIAFLQASGTLINTDLSITGNAIYNPAQYGVYLQACDDYDLSGNTIQGSGGYGIFVDQTCQDGSINGNTIKSTVQTGIYAGAASGSRCLVKNNDLFEVDTAGGASVNQNVFIYCQGPGEIDVKGNTVKNAAPAPTYSLASDATSSISLYDNEFPALKSDGSTIIYLSVAGTVRGAGRNRIGPFTSYTVSGVNQGPGVRCEFHAANGPDHLPVGGYYKPGDICWNINPPAGAPSFWECTTASNPGTDNGSWLPGPYLPNNFTLTAATATLNQNNQVVKVNFAGAVTITLPTSAQMQTSFLNKVFTIKDISGAAASNNISFAAGAGTSLEAANTITTNYGFVRWILDGTVWRTV